MVVFRCSLCYEEDVMIHYNNNDVYYRPVNAQYLKSIDRNTVLISSFLFTIKPYFHSHLF